MLRGMNNETDVPPAWAVKLYEGTLEQFGLVRAELAAHRAETAAGFRSVEGKVEMLSLAVKANTADLRDLKAKVDGLDSLAKSRP